MNVLTKMEIVAEWIGQIADRGGIPQRVREAAKGIYLDQKEAHALIAETLRALEQLDARVLPAAMRYHHTGPGYIEEAQIIVRAARLRLTGAKP